MIDQGSTFTFSVACGDDARDCCVSTVDEFVTDDTPAEEVMEITSLSGNIFLVEDWPDNQKLIGLYLQDLGIEYTLATNGEIAVELALEKDVDLILMDIQMPVMNGMEATDMLRAMGFSRPIIALTANVLREDVDHYLANGFNDVLPKPIDPDQFCKTLSKYLAEGSENRAQGSVQIRNRQLEPLAIEFTESLPIIEMS